MSTLEGRHNRPGPVAVGTSTEAQLPDLQRLEQEWRGRQDLSDSADDLRKGWAKLRAGYQKQYKKVVLRKSRQNEMTQEILQAARHVQELLPPGFEFPSRAVPISPISEMPPVARSSATPRTWCP